MLLSHGARPNEQDDAGNTPLHYAAKEGRLESVRLLVQFGGDCRRRNRSGNTVLEFGALNGWPHIVEYIINNTHAFKFKEVVVLVCVCVCVCVWFVCMRTSCLSLSLYVVFVCVCVCGFCVCGLCVCVCVYNVCMCAYLSDW